MKRSFLSETDFSLAEIEAVFQQARQLKLHRGKANQPKPLDGQTWAMLFHKSSTRTRISFEVGIHELGGRPMYLDQNRLQMGRGETIADTARVMGRYVHGFVIRTFDHALLEEFRQESGKPVINALTDWLHPCQTYTDAFSIAERLSGEGESMTAALRGRKVAFFGDCACNMAVSWIQIAAILGMELRLSGPAAYAPGSQVDSMLQQAGLPVNYLFTEDPKVAAQGADVLYTDVWVSMGNEDEREQRLKAMRPWQVNTSLMALAAPNAIFMHCLPAHEGEEVSSDVYQSPASIVYDQAENRLHVQKAILCNL
ncbi:MAG: ornithine carbamoyltransferase [Verrucomicrobia bacterium]|nr:ornithine carbamoyltransferase [Verrucomicrobiota bacterium]